MIATWGVEFKTGYDLSDNDRYRITELMREALHDLGKEYLADVVVKDSHFIPGPLQRCKVDYGRRRTIILDVHVLR
jgi:hypothetical protein